MTDELETSESRKYFMLLRLNDYTPTIFIEI